jgi:hypothetical protein
MGYKKGVETGLSRRKQSSEIWRHVDVVLTDVSEERIASIFRVEEKRRKSSEASVNTTSTRRHMPEYCLLHSHRSENLKSHTGLSLFPQKQYSCLLLCEA